MATTRIIPDACTEYEDGHIGAVAPSLANVEAKIGAAMGGLANRLYVFSGPDAKAQAKLVFRGGPLLKAIEEAFDAGSSTIYAWRVGQTAKASLDLNRKEGGAGIHLVAREGGAYWNRVNVTVDREIAEVIPNTWYLNAAANTLVLLDDEGQLVRSVDLSAHFVVARGCCIEFGSEMEQGDLPSVWIGGTDSDGHEVLRHFDADGTLIPEHSMDLSAFITTEQITALPFIMTNPDQGPLVFVSTPTKLYALQEIDSAVDVREARLSEVRAAFGDDAEAALLRDELAALQAGLPELEGQQLDLDLKVNQEKEREATIERKLYDGSVTNAKELTDLQRDLEQVTRGRQAQEERLLAVLEALDEKRRAVRIAEQNLNERESTWTAEQKRLQAEDARLSQELDALRAQREAQAAKLTAALVTQYDRLRRRRKGIAVAKVERGACLGCRLSVPAVVLQRARSTLQPAPAQCPSCERFLYVL